MARAFLLAAGALLSALSFVACGGDDDPGAGTGGSGATAGSGGTAGTGGSATCAPLATYPDELATTATQELAAHDALTALMTPMKDAEASVAVTKTGAELKALWEAGSPSLKSLTSPYYATQVEGWLDAFAAATGKTWTPAEPPPADGGIYEKWIFTATGTDLRQAIEKGLFGAAHYRSAVQALAADTSVAGVDRALVLYGAPPTFPQDDKDATAPDKYTAVYAKRRDDKTAADGMYRQIKQHFLAARAAAAVGADCTAEREAAAQGIVSTWEKVLMATVVYYANDATKKLGVDPPTDADSAAGLHGVGEIVGFVHGFRQLPATERVITDATIDQILGLLGAPPAGPVTTYKFATDGASELPKLQTVIQAVKDTYGFSDAEIESFKVNY